MRGCSVEEGGICSVQKTSAPMYRELDVHRIIVTSERLDRRIGERFPESGLGKVSGELVVIARESQGRINRGRRPWWWLRILAALTVLAIGGVAAVAGMLIFRIPPEGGNRAETIQAIDAALNAIILMAFAVYFLVNLEARVKRRAALKALHELRSIAHVIDMHQLTKDPEQLLSSPSLATPSSPPRMLNRFQLARYLNYCSELLSIASKLAALHAQYLNDPVVLSAVNDVESLAGDLSATVWQKTMILDAVALRAGEKAQAALER